MQDKLFLKNIMKMYKRSLTHIYNSGWGKLFCSAAPPSQYAHCSLLSDSNSIPTLSRTSGRRAAGDDKNHLIKAKNMKSNSVTNHTQEQHECLYTPNRLAKVWLKIYLSDKRYRFNTILKEPKIFFYENNFDKKLTVTILKGNRIQMVFWLYVYR